MIAAIAFAAFFSAAVADEGASAQQERGRRIYQTGRSTDGQPIVATLGNGGDALDASLVPCSQCHGDDGRGRTEGGVQPADIRPQTLARELASPTRTRPAYTRAQRVRAIALGVDAGGNALDRAMPRFQLTQADAHDLLAYLDVLGSLEPGVTDTSIVINVVGAAHASAPAEMIYGRHIVLQHDDRRGAFLTIDVREDGTSSVMAADLDGEPTLVVASDAAPGKSAFVIGASKESMRATLQQYARENSDRTVVFPKDCAELGHARRGSLVLMLLTEARPCHLTPLAAVDLRIDYVFVSASSSQFSDKAAGSALAIVMRELAGLGRDVHRDAMIQILQKNSIPAQGPFPEISWRAGRHLGARVAWLAQVDLAHQAVVPKPGWVSAEPPSP